MLCLMRWALDRNRNKLGAGNVGGAVRAVGRVAGRVLSARRGRFWAGIFGGELGSARIEVGAGRIGRPGRLQLGSIGWRGQNGGFLAFWPRCSSQVRMEKSEWHGQGLGIAGLSVREDQPDRLHRGAGRSIEAGPEGAEPPADAPTLRLPVAASRAQIRQKSRNQLAPIGLCQADRKAGIRADIPSMALGSGVRAAQCAGVNDRSVCRPKSPQKRGFAVGMGGEWSRSCACDVNELTKLGGGPRRVN